MALLPSLRLPTIPGSYQVGTLTKQRASAALLGHLERWGGLQPHPPGGHTLHDTTVIPQTGFIEESLMNEVARTEQTKVRASRPKIQVQVLHWEIHILTLLLADIYGGAHMSFLRRMSQAAPLA